MLVSIIVPVYNMELYLKQCVESLIGQTYQDIEIILVDDGSKDSSDKICDMYAELDKRVKVYHIKNSGPAEARNYGLTMATGKAIMFVDSDDWLEVTAIEKAAVEMEREDVDIVLFNMRDLGEGYSYDYQLFDNRKIFRETLLEQLENVFLTYRVESETDVTSLVGPVCKLYKRNKLEGSYFPKELTLGEDVCFVEQVIKASTSVLYIEDILYNRRVLENSMSHRIGKDYFLRRSKYVNWTINFYKDCKDYDLVNEFCFMNHCTVVINILQDTSISFADKRRMIKQYDESIQFNYDYKKNVIHVQNRNRRFLYELIQKKRIYTLLLVFKIISMKNRLKKK